jgi:thiol-disulfide isomerase/thioredoxin
MAVRFAALVFVVALSACKPAMPKKVRFIDAPREPAIIEKLVLEQVAASKAVDRTLVVYAGASWCEPCRRFHEAADRGDLNAQFGDVDFLAFDVDIDNERLAYGNYDTATIPMIALPGEDGKASSKIMSGSVKGDGAVQEMTPRLKALLGR